VAEQPTAGGAPIAPSAPQVTPWSQPPPLGTGTAQHILLASLQVMAPSRRKALSVDVMCGATNHVPRACIGQRHTETMHRRGIKAKQALHQNCPVLLLAACQHFSDSILLTAAPGTAGAPPPPPPQPAAQGAPHPPRAPAPTVLLTPAAPPRQPQAPGQQGGQPRPPPPQQPQQVLCSLGLYWRRILFIRFSARR